MRTGLILTVLAAFLVTASLYYLDYINLDLRKASPQLAISSNCPVFFEMDDLGALNKQIQGQPYWKDLQQMPFFSQFNQQFQALDSLLRIEQVFEQAWQGNQIVTMNAVSADAIDFLYLMSVEKQVDEMLSIAVNEWKRSGFKVEKRIYRKHVIYEVAWENPDLTFAFAMLKQTLAVSCTPFLVEEAIATVEENSSLVNDQSYLKVRDKSSGQSHVDMYVQYDRLSSLSTLIFNTQHTKLAKKAGEIASWSKFELLFDEQALLLNGYTVAEDSSAQQLSGLKSSTAIGLELIDIIPSNSAIVQYAGTTSPDQYLRRRQKGSSSEDIAYFRNWLGTEWAFGILESFKEDFTRKSFAVIQSAEMERAIENIAELQRLAEKDIQVIDPHRGYSIYRYQEDQTTSTPLLNRVFGNELVPIRDPYYTQIDDYLVFSNSLATLETILDKYMSNQTLGKDLNYINFAQQLSTSANQYFYLDGNKAQHILNEVLKPAEKDLAIRDQLSSKITFGLQYTWLDDLIFTNGVLTMEQAQFSGDSRLWYAQLDTISSTRPVIVQNHVSGQNEVFIQDGSHRIYLINQAGDVLWDQEIDGEIVSDVFQVDYYKNGKLQMVFNTRKFLYLIDRNGNAVENYPLKLSGEASGGMQVVDYDNEKNYRFFVPVKNKGVFAYYVSGKPVSGWRHKEFEHPINFPVQHILANGKDYLIITDRTGRIQAFNRKGRRRFKAVETGIEFNAPFQLEATPEGFQLVNGHKGTVYVVDQEGSLETRDVISDDNASQFVFGDISPDEGSEYIFFNGRSIKVFNQSREAVFFYDFEKPQKGLIALQEQGNASNYIGFYSQNDSKNYLINSAGALHKDFPIEGNAEFIVTDLFRNGEKTVVVPSKSAVVNAYRIQ